MDGINGKHKTTVVPKMYDWGLFFWRLPSGHLFGDGNGNLLNVQADSKFDFEAIGKIKRAAAHYGQPDGKPWFQPGLKRATDDEYSEQKERFLNGEVLLNDLGAVHAAQQGLKNERR
jgi:hypothetical protein